MKKPFWILAIVLGGGLVIAAWIQRQIVVIDYYPRCTRCLRTYTVVEKKLFGYTYSKTQKLDFVGYDLDEITGTPCQHIYARGGFGKQTFYLKGDGSFPEERVFRYRWKVLTKAFPLYQHFHNKKLMRETLDFADECIPPDATLYFLNTEEGAKAFYLSILADNLTSIQSEQDWKAALNSVKSQMAADAAKAK